MIRRAAIPAIIGLSTGLVQPAMGGVPVDITTELPASAVQVGDPLIIRMQVRNISGAPIDEILIYSNYFSLVYYPGLQEEGCQVEVFVPNPLPGPIHPPLFGYSWSLQGLDPGESANCQLTFPATLYAGTESIRLYSMYAGSSQLQAEFTYTLLPRGNPPGPISVPVGGVARWLLIGALLAVGIRRAHVGSKAAA